MNAILLSAGLGTRLRPLTLTTPKCLVRIKGEPLLKIWLTNLNKAGIKQYLINTHYLAGQVEKFVENSAFRSEITTTYEKNLLGTAGTLRKNLSFFNNNDGMLIHADNYTLADFTKFQKAHHSRPKQCLITMMTFNTKTPSSCGILETDKTGVVHAMHEKLVNPPGNIANGAIYILSKEFLMTYHLHFSDASCFSTEVLPKLMGRIYTYHTNDLFLDIGTNDSYNTANQYTFN